MGGCFACLKKRHSGFNFFAKRVAKAKLPLNDLAAVGKSTRM